MKTPKNSTQISIAQCAASFLILCLIFAVSAKISQMYVVFPAIRIQILLCLSLSACGTGLLALLGFFRFEPHQFTQIMAITVLFICVYNFLCMLVLYGMQRQELSVLFLLLQSGMQLLCLPCVSRFFDKFIKKAVLETRKHLVIGGSESTCVLYSILSANLKNNLSFLQDTTSATLFQEIEKFDYIYLCDSLPQEQKARILSECVRLKKIVSIIPKLYEISLHGSEMTQIEDILIYKIRQFSFDTRQRFFKRVVDIFLSLVGLCIASPLMLWAALAIKLEDGGNIFYRQTRCGRDGKLFRIIKFRSMVMHAEEKTGITYATDCDLRITKTGRKMRPRRIDELPQLFNVLAGSMSLVGPRPERPEFIEAFQNQIPEYQYRMHVKPGITGLAQVMGSYTTLTENKLKFDMAYITNYSLLLDSKILFRTLVVVLKNNKASEYKTDKADKRQITKVENHEKLES